MYYVFFPHKESSLRLFCPHIKPNPFEERVAKLRFGLRVGGKDRLGLRVRVKVEGQVEG